MSQSFYIGFFDMCATFRWGQGYLWCRIYKGELEVSMMIGGRGAEILYSILTEGYKEECCGC